MKEKTNNLHSCPLDATEIHALRKMGVEKHVLVERMGFIVLNRLYENWKACGIEEHDGITKWKLNPDNTPKFKTPFEFESNILPSQDLETAIALAQSEKITREHVDYIYRLKHVANYDLTIMQILFDLAYICFTGDTEDAYDQLILNLPQTIPTFERELKDTTQELIEVKNTHAKGGLSSQYKPHEKEIIKHIELYENTPKRDGLSQEKVCETLSQAINLTVKQSTFSTWCKKYSNGGSLYQGE
jgi:hypothetical protein